MLDGSETGRINVAEATPASKLREQLLEELKEIPAHGVVYTLAQLVLALMETPEDTDKG